MELSYLQKKELFENGFVKISGAVSELLVNEALKAINHSLGEGIPEEKLKSFRSTSFCPEVKPTPAITDLFYKSQVQELVGSVIDADQIHPITHGQVALRFPANDNKPKSPNPHIDGMYSPNNGVKEGEIENFTALVSVLLSDLNSENAGNFTVWPKTHHQIEKYFQEHGAETLIHGFPPIDLPEPVQLTGKAGDVFIVHYNLAHAVGYNISPNVRYATFYRIKHIDINKSNWQQSMMNNWKHWPGMQEFLPKN
jgi:ectoine hydroxylase-related dioxygenase (phytanoyl-CoA dioxygenase family)